MVKISTVILIVAFALAAGYSLVSIVVPTFVLEEDFRAITGKSYQDVLPPEAVRVSVSHIRHMEVFGLTTTIAGFFILFGGFRKGEKWAWWAMLVVGIIARGYGAVINLLNGNTFDSAVFLVGLVVFLVALFLPVKKFMVR